jgi:hypothetical protein
MGKAADKVMPVTLRPYRDKRSTSPVGYRIAHGAYWTPAFAGVTLIYNEFMQDYLKY